MEKFTTLGSEMTEHWLDDQFNSTLFGRRMMQRWLDLCVWEHFLNEHGDIVQLVELGTGNGMFSCYLLLQCIQRGISFQTFDRNPLPHTPVADHIGLRWHYRQADLWNGWRPFIEGYVAVPHDKPWLLYCDDGDKPREVCSLAPRLQPGDYLAVHDWASEIECGEIAPVAHLLERLMWRECEQMRSVTRFWRRC